MLVGLLAVTLPLRGGPQLGDDWKYDIVYRKTGRPLVGLILEKNDTHVLMRCISRRPGSPTVTIRESLPLKEIEDIKWLGPEDRAVLVNRLKNLGRERESLAAQLKLLDPKAPPDPNADLPVVTPAKWVQKDRGPGLEYRTPHFHLLSNCRKGVVQLLAIQLEQVYSAYQQNLPPRTKGGQPTTILVASTFNDYQALVVRAHGKNFFNPAFYDVERNEIVCHSELERLYDELEKSRQAHARIVAELDQRRTELNDLYKGKVPTELLLLILEDQKRIKLQDEQNMVLFHRAKQRLFLRLYHEAFHAYLANFVYPPAEGEVPRWLNEGLAQIYETAIIEAGDLRVGHVDRERFETIRTAAARETLLPLTELLRSSEQDFLVVHAEDAPWSKRVYLTSWALAHYLTFERKILGTPALDRYVKELKRGTDPLLAFRDLVAQPLEAFEKDFHGYLQRLRPNGTAGR